MQIYSTKAFNFTLIMVVLCVSSFNFELSIKTFRHDGNNYYTLCMEVPQKLLLLKHLLRYQRYRLPLE